MAEITCSGCRKRAELGGMRYSKDGKGLICEECWTKQTKGVSLKIKPQAAFTKASDNFPRKKVDFACRMCSFRWSRAIDFRGPKLCPNCGRDTVMQNLPTDANDLLEALDRMDDV